MTDDLAAGNNPFLASLNDLSKLYQVIWGELEISARKPNLPWGMAVLGSCDADDVPQLRTLVLRNVHQPERELTWHTDRRSRKFQQLSCNRQSSLLFWNPEVRVQLNLWGISTLHNQGERFDQEWELSELASRRAYLGDLAPGDAMPELGINFPPQLQHRPPTQQESLPGKANFGVIVTQVERMEILILRQIGNVRAQFVWSESDQAWNSNWQAP